MALSAVRPDTVPPVTNALAVEKLVATDVVLDKFVADKLASPVTYPPVITALPDEKFVTTNPVALPLVICALAVLKFVA